MGEWEKMMNPQKCFSGAIKMRGKCFSPFVVADVVELLCPFNIMKEKLTHESMWCWPVKWLQDFVEQFVELEQLGYLPKTSIYKKPSEFGISVTTLTLKVDFFQCFFFVFCFLKCVNQFIHLIHPTINQSHPTINQSIHKIIQKKKRKQTDVHVTAT
jgi:hypothetical protein